MNLDKYNEAITRWDQQNNQDVKSRAGGYGITHRKNSPSLRPSMSSFKSRLVTEDGAIVKISKVFPRTLVWVHKGAGKGRGGNVGSTWIDKYGKKQKTSEISKGKMGTGGRTAKPFINDSLDAPEGIERLATIAAEELGDALVGFISVK
jgi:hypothetical protein